MDSEIIEMTYEPKELKNYLIKRLAHLLFDLQTWITMHNKEQVRGNCNEIELMLIHLFGMRMGQINLIEEKNVRFGKYTKMKYGGYSLTSDADGNYLWLKDGKRVEPEFWLVDNGIGDMRAVKAAFEFQSWLKETGITTLDWMIEADIIPPALLEVMEYSFEGFEIEERQ